ncbi:hypothetical protein V500_04417 [Pseudogymnoascus sp. VKM F-4518 (FW-2643)]|nr:hypothetical protein V500_04417 [Pseudogymnoascus sp. VKM F-4518 (FW-2643)]
MPILIIQNRVRDAEQQASNAHSRPVSRDEKLDQMQREIEDLRNSQGLAMELVSPPVSTVPQPNPHQSESPSSYGSSITGTSTSAYLYNLSSFTVPSVPQSNVSASFSPSLEGIQLDTRKLQDCFSLYFKHYHPILNILEPQCEWQDYFTYSPLLFWTIIVTGSRRYSLDPTMLELLAPKVTTLAALAMTSISKYLPSISALLILCAWPLPMENASDDPSSVYAGAILQLALQNGLHMRSKRQDFAQNQLIKETLNQEISLVRLWGWCKVICHCTNIFSGLPPQIFEDAFSLEPHRAELFDSLHPSVFWMQRLESTLCNSLSTLMQNKYERQDTETSSLFLSMINHFDEEIVLLQRQSQDLLADIWFSSSRLHLGAFYFFCCQSSSKIARLIELYHVACAFVNHIVTRDQQSDYALYLSEQYYRTLTLAAATILKLCRSTELSSKLDLLLGEQSYFAAIQILKKRTLKNNDLNARMAAMLLQLWQSKRVFLQEDGSIDSLCVKIRSRGGMGVVYDCLWYWRQEFLGRQNPYARGTPQSISTSNLMASITPPVENQSNLQDTTTQQPYLEGNHFTDLYDDAFYSEWNWSTNDYSFGDLPRDLGTNELLEYNT